MCENLPQAQKIRNEMFLFARDKECCICMCGKISIEKCF